MVRFGVLNDEAAISLKCKWKFGKHIRVGPLHLISYYHNIGCGRPPLFFGLGRHQDYSNCGRERPVTLPRSGPCHAFASACSFAP